MGLQQRPHHAVRRSFLSYQILNFLSASSLPEPFSLDTAFVCWALSVFDPQDFVVSFFVELSVMMLERIYLDPGSKEVCTLGVMPLHVFLCFLIS